MDGPHTREQSLSGTERGVVGRGQHCHAGEQVNSCKLALFQEASFAGDLQHST